MKHAYNIRIIRVLKLVTGIEDLNAKYNLKNIYSDFEYSESKDSANTIYKALEPLTAFAINITNNITEIDFDHICNLRISSNQTRVVNHGKSISKA